MEEIFVKNSLALFDSYHEDGNESSEKKALTATQRAMLKVFPNTMLSKAAFLKNIGALVKEDDCPSEIRDIPGFPDAAAMFDYLENEGLVITSCGFTVIDAMQRLLRKCKVKGIHFENTPKIVFGATRAVGLKKVFEFRYLFWPVLLPAPERDLMRQIMQMETPFCSDVFDDMTRIYEMYPQMLAVLMDNLLAKNCIVLAGTTAP